VAIFCIDPSYKTKHQTTAVFESSRLFGLSWLGALYFRAIIRFNLKAPDPDHLCNSPLIPVCSATMLLTEDHV
ncbi:hypothetical protein GBAR_LOCUS8404, partial [Geodia barretti]